MSIAVEVHLRSSGNGHSVFDQTSEIQWHSLRLTNLCVWYKIAGRCKSWA